MNLLIVLLFFLLERTVSLTVQSNGQAKMHITAFINNSTQNFLGSRNQNYGKITVNQLNNTFYKLHASKKLNNKKKQKNSTVNSNAFKSKKQGAFCYRKSDGRSGYCMLANECLHAIKERLMYGVKLDFCTHKNSVSLICCPLQDKHRVVQSISAEKCLEYHTDLKNMQLSTPLELSGKQCTSSNPMVVGGKRAQSNEYPHMAALGWTSSDGQIKWSCGGTLVSEQFVLTAAHCTTSMSEPPDIVRLGALHLNETTRLTDDVKVLIIILHPEYRSSSYYNDIALLKLTKSVKLSKSIRPACLWQQGKIPTKTITATGWGRTKFNGPKSNELLKVELDLLNQDLCKNFYQTERRLSRGLIESQFCAGHIKGGKDTCQGDSGGPIHIELPEYNCIKFVAGITSFGKVCAAPNAPGVYTKIHTYIEWIENIVFKS